MHTETLKRNIHEAIVMRPIDERNRLSPEARFWQKVRKAGPNACWRWTASRSQNGYGKFLWNGETTTAHRASWEIHYGPVPEGKFIIHACEHKDCVNPAHLYLGSRQDYVDRAKQAGRYGAGESHSQVKLTTQQVREIRDLSDIATYEEIAEYYGVSPSQVCRIVRRKAWAHL